MALATERAQGSQWLASQQEGPATATIHPSAAAGLIEGNLARLESEIGQIVVRLRFDTRQRPDVVLMEKGEGLKATQEAAAAALKATEALVQDELARLVERRTNVAAQVAEFEGLREGGMVERGAVCQRPDPRRGNRCRRLCCLPRHPRADPADRALLIVRPTPPAAEAVPRLPPVV